MTAVDGFVHFRQFTGAKATEGYPGLQASRCGDAPKTVPRLLEIRTLSNIALLLYCQFKTVFRGNPRA